MTKISIAGTELDFVVGHISKNPINYHGKYIAVNKENGIIALYAHHDACLCEDISKMFGICKSKILGGGHIKPHDGGLAGVEIFLSSATFGQFPHNLAGLCLKDSFPDLVVDGGEFEAFVKGNDEAYSSCLTLKEPLSIDWFLHEKGLIDSAPIKLLKGGLSYVDKIPESEVGKKLYQLLLK